MCAQEVPPSFWVAAASMFAYVVGVLAARGLAEVVHHSQLMGYAPIRRWGIRSQQYPSTSLLDWETGEGTAKYWVTKLLIDALRPRSRVASLPIAHAPTAGVEIVCAELGMWTSDGMASLACDEPDAFISQVDFADFGMPNGVCGQYKVASH